MKQIKYSNYQEAFDKIIKQCNIIQDPLTIYKIIVDDPDLLEEAYFYKKETLFQIEFLSWNQFLQEQLDNYLLSNHKKASKLEKIITLDSLLQPGHLFYQSSNLYAMIDQLLQIFDEFYLGNVTTIPYDQFDSLARKKITTCFSLYQSFLQALPDTLHLSLMEPLLHHPLKKDTSTQYIFFTRQINYPKVQTFLQYLDQYYQITIMYFDVTTNKKHNDYIGHLQTHLFQTNHHYQGDHPFYLLQEPTPKDQIRQVLLHIYKQVVDQKRSFQDFSIYYPNEEYLEIIQTLCLKMNLPISLHLQTAIHPGIQTCLAFFHYVSDSNIESFLSMLDYSLLNIPFSISQIKKEYQESHQIKNDHFVTFINQLQPYINALRQATTLSKHVAIMKELIETYFLETEEKYSCLSFFDTFSNITYSLDFSKFKELILLFKPKNQDNQKPMQDSIYLLNYKQPYSSILQVKECYLLGFNETIIPSNLKDEGILLNKERIVIDGIFSLQDQKRQECDQYLQVLSNKHQRMVLCMANGTLQGDPLLQSSIIVELKNLFDLRPMDSLPDYLHPAFYEFLYLQGNNKAEKNVLNHMITRFTQSKNQPHNIHETSLSILSASQLETYNSCPYKHFHQYRLHIQPMDSHLFLSHELGSFIHYVLDSHSDLLQVVTFDKKSVKQSIVSSINTYLKNNPTLKEKAMHPMNQYFIECLEEDLYLTLLILKNQMQASNFTFKNSETKVTGNYDALHLLGFVDRVDQYQHYIKVIDYKSSDKSLDLALAKKGFHIQMLLYLDMLCKSRNAKKGAVLYFNTKRRILKSKQSILEKETEANFFQLYKMNGYVNQEVIDQLDTSINRISNIIPVRFVKKDDAYKGNILDDQGFNEIVDDVADHIISLYHQMNQGNIAILPKGSKNPSIHHQVHPCSYCPYRSLCKFDIFYNEIEEIGGENDD